MWIGIELEPPLRNLERIQLIQPEQTPTREEIPDPRTMLRVKLVQVHIGILRGPIRMDTIVETLMDINNRLVLILVIVISILDQQLSSEQIPIASQPETLHSLLGLQPNLRELKLL